MDESNQGKEFLKSMREYDALIKQLKKQIHIEKDILMDTAVHYKDIQVQTSGAKDKMFENMPHIMDIQSEIREYVAELAARKLKAMRILRRIEPRRQRLLMLYYMQGNTIEQTAEEMRKSYTWTWCELQAAEKDFEVLYLESEAAAGGNEKI